MKIMYKLAYNFLLYQYNKLVFQKQHIWSYNKSIESELYHKGERCYGREKN